MDFHTLSILGTGFALGLRHALDADHVVAISTILSERKGFKRSLSIGVAWGVGHLSSLLAVALLMIAFDVTFSPAVSRMFEFGVGLLLVGLGVRVLWKLYKGSILHIHSHEHERHLHLHPHMHEGEVGHNHRSTHHHPAVTRTPFIVGMVHGLAGSAALMLVVLATISSRSLALVYVGVFSLGSVGGMFLMSALIGFPLAIVSRYKTMNTIVCACAGAISLCFGVWYAWQTGVLANFMH